MNYDPEQHHRRSIRKERFDYTSAGGYFVTICTNDKRHLFGAVCNERMHLNDAGNVITKTWNILPTRFPTVKLNEFVIMPNHLHGIIVISNTPDPTLSNHPSQQPNAGATLDDHPQNVGATPCGCPIPPCDFPSIDTEIKHGHPHGGAPTLGDIVGWFKSMTTNKYIHGVKQNGWPPFDGRLWQRNYYERIIRDDEWEKIAAYINANPAEWHTDQENPHATPRDPEHPWQT